MEYFKQVVKQQHGVTFREQAKWWLNHVRDEETETYRGFNSGDVGGVH